MKVLQQSIICLICSLCCYLNTQAAINSTVSDSTYQEVIEFTHKKNNKSKDYFFRKGEKVVVKKKGKLFPFRGKIEGFTEDGILIKGQEIKIDEIKSIRRKSLLAFIFSLFSWASILSSLIVGGIIIGILGTIGRLGGGGGDDPLAAAIFFFILIFLIVPAILAILSGLAALLGIVLLVGILLGIASLATKRTNKFFNLKRWDAQITTKKLPIE